MFIIITLLLTVLVSGIFGAVPAVVSRRRVSRRDAAWAAGLWLAVWVFALCAYHRPGLTVGFHPFRLGGACHRRAAQPRAQRVKGRRPAAGRHGAGAGGVRRQCGLLQHPQLHAVSARRLP